mgnify:CR=1 FL=1
MLITNANQITQYYKALVDRDASYVGIFYVGVKTTSVFCIATCRARKPKFENVAFYTRYKNALEEGYRPCKICRPTENANEAPKQVEHAIQMVRNNPKEKVSDEQLKINKISPELVRRWFNKNYGMTFQAFQRMYRVNNALIELKSGKKATDIAFEAGYESLSGFGYTYKKLVGQSPKHSMGKNIILISRSTTPLGPIFICATNVGVCLVEFVDKEKLEKEFSDIQKYLKAKIIAGENEHIKQAKKEISEYFDGQRKNFSVALDMPSTDFQSTVWHALLNVGYGQTVSYQQQAQTIDKPKATRAVAAANGANRIAIIVPCHRVIGKNGELTGYGGPVERKRWLIDHEKENIS